MIKLVNLFLYVSLIFIPHFLHGQVFNINVTKEHVNNDFEGYGLQIIVQKNYRSDTISPGDYSKALGFAQQLDKKEKIKLLDEITPFFNDYSLCGYRVKTFFPFDDVHGAKKYDSEKYSIAIESMYLINLMFFGEYARYIANIPVLFDLCDKKEILYNDSSQISLIGMSYTKWLDDIKNNIDYHDFSLYNLFDFYRGTVIWIDTQYMPESSKIIAEIHSQLEINKNDTHTGNKKNVF